MSGHSAEEVRKSLKTYWGIFFALLVLTGITVWLSTFHFTIGIAIFIAMIVAGTKGSLVAGFFMHLIGEKKIIFWVLGLTATFFVLVMVLPILTDHGNNRRGTLWTPVPKTEAPAGHHEGAHEGAPAEGEAGHSH